MEKPTKNQFQAYLAGQIEARKFIEAERDRRLAEMTPSEIRDQFDALCELLPLRRARDGAAADEERLSFLLERRRLLHFLAARSSP